MSNLYLDDGPEVLGQKVMLATTAYDSPDASYSFSISKSREALSRAGIDTAYLLLSGNCHVDDARNTVVKHFLESDCTDLVFLDADVSWGEGSIVALCEADLSLCGGVYPYRREVMGHKNKLPYRQMAGVSVNEGILEVEGLPTGFMRIRRNVIDTLIKDAAWNDDIPILFERTFVDGKRWSGDINFCRKWREAGGQIFALTELRLGHLSKSVLHDSLAASLRRSSQTTLFYVADRIKKGINTSTDIKEAFEYVGNLWGANEEVLTCALAAARKATAPIIETGSGLTTIIMAAATDQTVWCLEHNKHFAAQTKAMAAEAGVSNIAIVHCSIKDGWYDLSEDWHLIPDNFSLGLNDGPPRLLGDRMGFFEHFGDKCDIIISDDADSNPFKDNMTEWADGRGLKITYPYERAAIMTKEAA